MWPLSWLESLHRLALPENVLKTYFWWRNLCQISTLAKIFAKKGNFYKKIKFYYFLSKLKHMYYTTWIYLNIWKIPVFVENLNTSMLSTLKNNSESSLKYFKWWPSWIFFTNQQFLSFCFFNNTAGGLILKT